MVWSGIVKLVADADIVRFFRDFDTPTERLLREEGFAIGDFKLRHFLSHFFSKFHGGYYSSSVIIDKGSRVLSAGGINPMPREHQEVTENLFYLAGRYLGIGPEPLTAEPPYVVLTTPDECGRVIEVFRRLDCTVEEIERKAA